MIESIATTPPATLLYTEVFHSQHVQYDSAHVQRHDHHKEHTEVKKQCILRYSLIII